jgi:transposase-like protein
VYGADPQSTSDATPKQTPVGGIVIQVDDERHWLDAAADSDTDEIRHVRLCHARTIHLTVLLLRDLREQRRWLTPGSSSILHPIRKLHSIASTSEVG